jgi:hypothetical protein
VCSLGFEVGGFGHRPRNVESNRDHAEPEVDKPTDQEAAYEVKHPTSHDMRRALRRRLDAAIEEIDEKRES